MIKERPDKLAPQCRSLSLRADGLAALNEESRTVRFPFSSEEPCDMWYGTEILSHAAGCMRMGQRQAAMPLLFNHDRNDLLGVVESIELDPAARRGYCTVRFGRDERGDWAMQQARDGVLVNASFMYRVFRFEEDVEEEIYTATDWEPYEISLVTIPADPTVGVGRAAGDAVNAVAIAARVQSPATADTKELITMTTNVNQPAAETGKQENIDLHAEQRGAEFERKRMLEIEALCAKHNVPAEVRAGLIQKGASVAEAQGAVLDLVLSRGAKQASLSDHGFAPDMSAKEKANYSMIRAINAAINQNWKEAGFELEVSNDIAKRMGRGTQGFFMPTNLPVRTGPGVQYADASGSGTGGAALVATNLLAGNFIEVLRNKARVMQLGATVLSGLTGNVDIPRQSGVTSTYWVTEGGAVTEAEPAFDKITLQHRTIGALQAVTRRMLAQSTPDIEMLLRADLIAQIALGIDAAALYGTGLNGQPTGIAATSGIGAVVGGTNGAALTIDHLIDLETALTENNAPEESLAYLGNARTVGALKKLKSTTGQYLWTNLPGGQRSGTPGEINGYTFARSNQARKNLTKGTQDGSTAAKSCSEIFFGAWSELLIGEWGVLEIVPNPYDSTLYPQGGVLLRALQSLDIGVRHPVSFARMADAIVS